MKKVYLIGNLDSGGGAELQMRLINDKYKDISTIITLKDKGILRFLFCLILNPSGHVLSFHRRTDILACLFGYKHDIIIRESNSAYAKNTGFFERMRILLVKLSKSKVVSNNMSGKEYWEKNLGNKVFILPNLFEKPKGVTEALRNGTLIVGRLEPHKAVDKSILLADTLDQEIKVIGDGSLRKELQIMSESAVLPEISFLGHIEQDSVYIHMENSLNLVHLSEYEGFPNVIIQAKLRGMRVFASKNRSNLTNIPNVVDFWVNKDLEIEKNYSYDFNIENFLKQNNEEFEEAFSLAVFKK